MNNVRREDFKVAKEILNGPLQANFSMEYIQIGGKSLFEFGTIIKAETGAITVKERGAVVRFIIDLVNEKLGFDVTE